ncbi:MAG TPA: hypothetical protein PLH09_04905, partial [Lentimicrobium sp.]|nr:hypothetical protein [Lentimicrobium sp.]
MERTIKYLIRLFALFFVVSIAWGIPVPYDLTVNPGPEAPPASPPDTTKPGGALPYPIPDTEPGAFPDPSDKNKLFLGNTSNFTEEIIYDPATNTYSIVRKAGAVPLSSPTTLTFDEFKELDLDRSLQSYWREKAVSSGGVSRTGIIPQIHIGGQVFDRIFGGNTIDIRPQGSAEVTFGILSNRRDDPALDIRQ